MLSVQLQSIEQKVQHIISLCEKYREQNQELLAENETLKRIVKEQKEGIKELTEKQQVLKLAKSFSETNEKTLDTKQKITEFVREIDKCIALLNG